MAIYHSLRKERRHFLYGRQPWYEAGDGRGQALSRHQLVSCRKNRANLVGL
jgi:hypothetical protein